MVEKKIKARIRKVRKNSDEKMEKYIESLYENVREKDFV